MSYKRSDIGPSNTTLSRTSTMRGCALDAGSGRAYDHSRAADSPACCILMQGNAPDFAVARPSFASTMSPLPPKPGRRER